MAVATVAIITSILIVYVIENAKWVSSLFKMITGAQLKIDNDLVAFSGAQLMKAHVWVLFTSIFFHANLKHVAYEIFILLVAGSASEAKCGSVLFASIFFAGGILGQIASWCLLRRDQIRDDPKYGAMLADLCLWRGSSGCTFTAVGFAISIAGGMDLCDLLPARIFPNSLAPVVAGIWLVTAALSHKFWDADSRCFAAPVLWTCVFLCAGVLLSAIFAAIAVKVTVGIFVACLFGLRVLVCTFPGLATREVKESSLAMTDHVSHIFGTGSGLLAGWGLRLMHKGSVAHNFWWDVLPALCVLAFQEVVRPWIKDELRL